MVGGSSWQLVFIWRIYRAIQQVISGLVYCIGSIVNTGLYIRFCENFARKENLIAYFETRKGRRVAVP